ncbi:MAG: hypothetical protein RSE93_08570, partial [Oscillospiraceae bacterium]
MTNENMLKLSSLNFKNFLSVILALIFFVFPFFGKLTEPNILFAFETAIFIVALIWMIYKLIKHEHFKLNTLLIIPALLFVIAHIIPIILGGSVQSDYIIRYCALFSIFIILADISKDRLNTFIFLNAIALSGVIFALLSIDSALGALVSNALNLSNIGFDGYRTVGLLQHAPSSAIYLTVTVFSLIFLSLSATKRLMKLIYTGLIAPVVIAICLTMTPVSIIIFGICYIFILLMLYKKGEKIEFLIYSVVAILSGFIFFLPITKAALDISTSVHTFEELLVARNAGTI